jgi:DNA-directed RNA polymerase specialized sigma24 family protein
MRDDDFDLDVIEHADAHHEQFVAALDRSALERSVAALPHDLVAAATGVLLQGRTYSDVSQELGIRQPELVRALQRARAIIAREHGQGATGGAA